MANLITTDDVKRLLDIEDFRHLTKEKIIEFVSSIPEMDKDVAVKCLEQFPNFKESSISIVNHYYDLCHEAIQESGKASIKVYEAAITECQNILNSENELTDETKKYLIDKMVEIGNNISKVEERKENFAMHVLRLAGSVGSLVIVVTASLLGLKINSPKK